MCRQWAIGLLGLAFGLSATPRAGAQEPEIDFQRDVRPILSDKCFQCHGPDDDTREAELRLDTREGLFAERDGAVPFVPGNPQQSEALRRMRSHDELEQMPPPDSNKKLTEQQISLMQRWVKHGAPWSRQWAFVAPQRPPLPDLQPTDWPRNEIDHFVLARLADQGLKPSPPASPIMLVRRLYLDLIGLPPTPDQADAWVQRIAAANPFRKGQPP